MSATATASISLIGMPGSGKSTVGRQLARRLGLPLFDTDAEIERQAGCPIRELFERDGEGPFRDLEAAMLGRLVDGQRGILSTGGGIVLRPSSRQLLRDRTVCIYLRSNPEDLFRRLRHDAKRPLLQVADPLRRLRELHVEREPLYREAAHYVIDTGRPSVPTLVNMILMQLELAGAVDPHGVPSPVDTKRPASPG